MSIRFDWELQQLQAEADRLTEYVAPHEMMMAWLTLVSIMLSCGAAVFVLAGWIAGEVHLANLVWMTLLAAVITSLVTRRFHWRQQSVTLADLARLMLGQVLPFPDDLDQARTRLIVCEARIAQLKRSRR